MNRFELKEALDHAGVAAGAYALQDVLPNPVSDSTMVLRGYGDHWEVVVAERGNEFDLRSFTSEDDACRYVLAQLTWPGPATDVIATPEQDAAALRLAEERLVELRALLRSRGLDPLTGLPE